MAIRLVVLDCDGTLWEHEDVLTLRPPFTRIDDHTARDAGGELVRLTPGARELLEELRARGILISICSWNLPEPVFGILDQLGLTGYFVHPKVQFHPNKELMIAALLKELAEEGRDLRPDEVMFVDDNPRMLEKVRRGVGPVRTLRAGVDVQDLREVLNALDDAPGHSPSARPS